MTVFWWEAFVCQVLTRHDVPPEKKLFSIIAKVFHIFLLTFSEKCV